jgi:uncharacterized protein YkvS
MKSLFKTFLLGFLFLLGGCNKLFDYSPYAIDFEEENSKVNPTNIKRLSSLKENDTIQIAFTGDSHNYFDELELFVEKVNAMKNIDFVVHVGDIADFGLPKQYLWGNSYLLNLKIPYLVTIGNHDLVGNGMEAYLQMFGELNFSFVYQGIKFIFLNTNSLEFAYNGTVPNLDWLALQLIPNGDFSKAVVIFHMPPGIGFDPNLEAGFYQIISQYQNVIMAVHGHAHHFDVYYPTFDSIPFINVYGLEHRKMTSIKIFQNQLYVKNFEF